jgi:hypothetical protein
MLSGPTEASWSHVHSELGVANRGPTPKHEVILALGKRVSLAWSGQDWQRYCQELFALRHGVDYQSVPDRVHGDWGIEGLSATGVLYQCYAPAEPLTRKDLAEKLRDKITADLGKLVANIAAIQALVQPAAITHWVLVVPRIEDKAVIAHAARHAEQIRSSSYAGVDPGFVARVCTADDFPEERRRLGENHAIYLPAMDSATDSSAARYLPETPLSLENLSRKLAKLTDPRSYGQDRLKLDFIKYYLDGQKLERVLQASYPTQYETWRRARHGVSRELGITEMTLLTRPGERVRDVKQKLSDSAVREIPSLGTTNAEMLAYGTIAEWLLECPLDFAVKGVR